MGIEAIAVLVLRAATAIMDNSELLGNVLSGDELTDEEKARIRNWRKSQEKKWQDLLPKDSD